jgi:hypothetical protein
MMLPLSVAPYASLRPAGSHLVWQAGVTMTLNACLNDDRSRADHPAVTVTPAELAEVAGPGEETVLGIGELVDFMRGQR